MPSSSSGERMGVFPPPSSMLAICDNAGNVCGVRKGGGRRSGSAPPRGARKAAAALAPSRSPKRPRPRAPPPAPTPWARAPPRRRARRTRASRRRSRARPRRARPRPPRRTPRRARAPRRGTPPAARLCGRRSECRRPPRCAGEGRRAGGRAGVGVRGRRLGCATVGGVARGWVGGVRPSPAAWPRRVCNATVGMRPPTPHGTTPQTRATPPQGRAKPANPTRQAPSRPPPTARPRPRGCARRPPPWAPPFCCARGRSSWARSGPRSGCLQVAANAAIRAGGGRVSHEQTPSVLRGRTRRSLCQSIVQADPAGPRRASMGPGRRRPPPPKKAKRRPTREPRRRVAPDGALNVHGVAVAGVAVADDGDGAGRLVDGAALGLRSGRTYGKQVVPIGVEAARRGCRACRMSLWARARVSVRGGPLCDGVSALFGGCRTNTTNCRPFQNPQQPKTKIKQTPHLVDHLMEADEPRVRRAQAGGGGAEAAHERHVESCLGVGDTGHCLPSPLDWARLAPPAAAGALPALFACRLALVWGRLQATPKKKSPRLRPSPACSISLALRASWQQGPCGGASAAAALGCRRPCMRAKRPSGRVQVGRLRPPARPRSARPRTLMILGPLSSCRSRSVRLFLTLARTTRLVRVPAIDDLWAQARPLGPGRCIRIAIAKLRRPGDTSEAVPRCSGAHCGRGAPRARERQRGVLPPSLLCWFWLLSVNGMRPSKFWQFTRV